MHKPFEIGLVMAGAVSAGAYTAGVMDFLIQALDTWQKAKEVADPKAPRHRTGDIRNPMTPIRLVRNPL